MPPTDEEVLQALRNIRDLILAEMNKKITHRRLLEELCHHGFIDKALPGTANTIVLQSGLVVINRSCKDLIFLYNMEARRTILPLLAIEDPDTIVANTPVSRSTDPAKVRSQAIGTMASCLKGIDENLVLTPQEKDKMTRSAMGTALFELTGGYLGADESGNAGTYNKGAVLGDIGTGDFGAKVFRENRGEIARGATEIKKNKENERTRDKFGNYAPYSALDIDPVPEMKELAAKDRLDEATKKQADLGNVRPPAVKESKKDAQVVKESKKDAPVVRESKKDAAHKPAKYNSGKAANAKTPKSNPKDKGKKKRKATTMSDSDWENKLSDAEPDMKAGRQRTKARAASKKLDIDEEIAAALQVSSQDFIKPITVILTLLQDPDFNDEDGDDNFELPEDALDDNYNDEGDEVQSEHEPVNRSSRSTRSRSVAPAQMGPPAQAAASSTVAVRARVPTFVPQIQLPGDDLSVCPPGYTFVPGQIVGPSDGTEDNGYLVYLFVDANNQIILKHFAGYENFNWGDPASVARLNKWRKRVVRTDPRVNCEDGAEYIIVSILPFPLCNKSYS